MLGFFLLLCLSLAPFTFKFTVADDGANVSVDDIKLRPEYNFSAPQEFFILSDDSGSVNFIPGTDAYQAQDFGAVADPTVDNRAAIQDAIDAAHAAGGGMVVLQSGTFGISKQPGDNGAILMKDNVFLKGNGIGKTVLRVVDGWNEDLDDKLTGIIRSPWGEATKNYGIADLTLDGNRENTKGLVDGFYNGGRPGGTITDEDVWIVRVETRYCSGYGFDPHERNERLTITDSISHHNGKDGFVADYIIDGVYKNNIAYENDRHGFNIVTSTHDLLLSNNIARDNGGGGIVVQRGSFDIPVPHNIMVAGGESSRNGKEGVLFLMCYNIEIKGVDVLENGSYGVRIHGSSHVSVSNNQIINNSRSKDGGYAGIQIKDYTDVKNTNRTYFAENNTISGNVIEWTTGLSGKAFVEVLAVNDDSNNIMLDEDKGYSASAIHVIISGVSIAVVAVTVLILVWWWRNEKRDRKCTDRDAQIGTSSHHDGTPIESYS